MTQVEIDKQAKELIDRFYKGVLTRGFAKNDTAQIFANMMWWDEAKQCALVCVDREIALLNDIIGVCYDYDISTYEQMIIDKKELKQEIEKL